MSAKEFFDGLEARAEPSDLAQIDHSYLFKVAGAGSWLVEVRDGKLQVTEGYEGAADVTISTSEETFDALASGRQNPTWAYMTGKLKVEGDTGAALKLQKLF